MDIPEYVIECLEEVRSGGACNMVDRACVMAAISRHQMGVDAAMTIFWLHADEGEVTPRATPTQRERYLAALDALGTRRAAHA